MNPLAATILRARPLENPATPASRMVQKLAAALEAERTPVTMQPTAAAMLARRVEWLEREMSELAVVEALVTRATQSRATQSRVQAVG